MAFWSLRKWKFFGTFTQKDGRFERWRRAILLQERGEFFCPSLNRRFALSGAQNIHKNSIFARKDATSELDFEAENLLFHHKMWSNETALKQRKKRPSPGRAPVTEIRRN